MMKIMMRRLTAVFTLTAVLAYFGAVRDATAERSEMGPKQIQRLVATIAAKNGTVPPALALAVAQVESNFRADAKSPVGAQGVMQIMPATAKGVFNISADHLRDPKINVRIGVSYLERLYRQYGGRWDLALSHYNGGSLKRQNGRYVAHSYTRGYVAKVMRYWRQFQRTSTAIYLARVDQKTPTIRFLPTGGKMTTQQARAISNGWWERKLSWRQYLNIADRLLSRELTKSPTSRVRKPQMREVVGTQSKEVLHNDALLRFHSESSLPGDLYKTPRFM